MLRSLFLITALLSVGLATPAAAQGRPESAGDDDEKRLQRLEEQVVDLNAQLGTIESMTRGAGAGGGSSPPSGGGGSYGGDDGARLAQMSAQINDLIRRLERIEARFGGISPSAPSGNPGTNYGEAPRGGERSGAARPSEQGTGFSVGGADAPADPTNFGSSSGERAGQRSSLNAPEPRSNDRSAWATDASPLAPTPLSRAPAPESSSAPVRVAALSSPQAQSLYDQAYTALTQRNYRAASDGFEQFIQRHPADPLAGSAQFWLGEAAFTSGEYRKAADMFLKTTTNYPQNEKAAESMLKLGISLKRLGENDAACSSFSELTKRYPSATAILQRAETEKRRASC